MTQPYVDLDAYDAQKLAEAQALEQAQAAAAKTRQAEAAANVATPPISAEFDADAYAAAQQGAPTGGPVKVAIVPTTAATVQAGPTAPQGGGTQDKYASAPLAPKYLGTVSSGGGYTPAHEVVAVGPTTLAAVAQERAAQGEAVDAMKSAALQNAMAAAVARDEMQAAQEEARRQAEADAEAARRSREEYTAKLQAVSDEGTRLAQEKIDPKRFWANSSTGSQIAMGLGAIFSGALAGFQGRGGNEMLDRIDRMIDRDVQSQVDSYNARAKSVEARRSMYGQLLQQTHGDENAAKAIMRDAQVKKAMAMADYAASASKSAEMMAKAQAFKADLAERNTAQVAKMMPYVQASSAPVKRTHVMRLPNGAIVEVNDAQAVAMSEKDADRDLKASEQMNATAKQRREQADDERERFVPTPGGGFMAAGKTEGKEIREQFAGARDAISQIDRALELRKKTSMAERGAGKIGLTTNDVARLQAAGKAIGVGWSKAKKMGTWDAGTERVVTDIVGNPASIMSMDVARLQQLRSDLAAQMQTIEAQQTGAGTGAPTPGARKQ